MCYSGVVGKLTATSYEYVLRFNMYETKKKAVLSDVFDIPAELKPEIPEEWLSQIGKPAPAVSYGNYNRYGNYGNFPKDRGTTGSPLSQENNPGSTMISRRQSLEDLLNEDPYEAWWRDGVKENLSSSGKGRGGASLGNGGSNTFPTTGDGSDPDHELDLELIHGNGLTPENAILLEEMEVEETLGHSPSQYYTVGGKVIDTSKMTLEDYEKLSKTQKIELRLQWAAEGLDPDVMESKITGDREGLDDKQIFEAEYGKDVGEAFEQITIYMDDICDVDEVLLKIIGNAYDMLSDEAKAKVATEGIQSLI